MSRSVQSPVVVVLQYLQTTGIRNMFWITSKI